MKIFTRYALVLIGLFLLLFGTAEAQESCNLSSTEDYYSANLNAFWSGDYQQALEVSNCGIAQIPADMSRNLPLDINSPVAGLFLGRAWANLMLGNQAQTHADFYEWIQLTESTTVTEGLQEGLSENPLEMSFGLVYRFTFYAYQGQIVNFYTESSNELDPLLVLLAPSGTALTSDDDGGAIIHNDWNSHIVDFALPETGLYTLVVSQAHATTIGNGSMQLHAEFASGLGTAQAAACNLLTIRDYLGSGDNFLTSGNYERAIALYDCGIALLPADENLALPLAVYDPLPVLYLNRAWANLMLGNAALTYDDFYRWIELTEAQTIEESLAAALAANPLMMEEGLVYRLSFEGHQGEMVSFSSFTNDDIDPLFVLLAPDGSVLVADDDGGADLEAPVDSHIRNFVLPATGTYTLVISQAGWSGSGTMQLLDEHPSESN